MKFKMSVVFAALVFALPLPAAFGQAQDAITVSAQLVDKSSPGTPFTFAGAVKCSEWVDGAELRSRAEGTIDVTNTSHRQIVAWATRTSVNCLHAGSHDLLTVRDHFFKDHSLPEENWKIPADFNEGMDISEDGKRKDPYDLLRSPAHDPVFTAELTFVQFDDGSIWGSTDVFAQIESKRDAVEEVLHQLQNLQQKSGVGAVIDRVRDALQAAERRKASGRF